MNVKIQSTTLRLFGELNIGGIVALHMYIFFTNQSLYVKYNFWIHFNLNDIFLNSPD